MIVVGLLVFFAVLGGILALVAYTSNNRKRAGQNPTGMNTTTQPQQGRAGNWN